MRLSQATAVCPACERRFHQIDSTEERALAVAGWLAEAVGRVVAVKHDSTCDWATSNAWCDCGLDDAFEAGHRAGAAEVRARVEASLSNHPDVCDRYNDEDVVSCGWKSAVIGVRAALATEPEEGR